MEFVLLWIVLCVVVGFLGNSRTIGFGGAFFLSLILSPLLGLIFVLVSKDKQTDSVEKKILADQQAQQQATVATPEESQQAVVPPPIPVAENVPQKKDDGIFFTILILFAFLLLVLYFSTK